mgnify:CR=1 FL=1
MRIRITILTTALLCICGSDIEAQEPTSYGRPVELGGEVVVPLHPGWQVIDSVSGYPYEIVNSDTSAELSIHRSIISSDEAIDSPDELKTAVDSVVATVISTLPQAHLLSSTGYGGESEASFALEFESYDDASKTMLHQRLVGHVYRHPDGHQLMFTLWGRVAPSVWDMVSPSLISMQDGFVYRGPSEETPFARPGYDPMKTVLLVAVVVMVVIVLVRFHHDRRAVEPSRWERRWVCECGAENELTIATCRQCGKARPMGGEDETSGSANSG